jgi:hypothetical protein
MARSPVPGFVGPSNVGASTTADPEETINLFLETVSPGTVKTANPYLRGTPGLRPWVNLPTAPVTAMFFSPATLDRAFAIAGDTLYEVFPTNPATYVAYFPAMAPSVYLPSICSNGTAGNQLFITCGGLGYIFNLNANTLTQITDPGFPSNVRMGEFMDGYFFALVTETRKFQISALEDGTTWDALDVAERSEASDDINALVRNHRVVCIIGRKTSEFWYDSGDPLFPFAPTSGEFMESGSVAPFSVRRLENTLFWLGQNDDGQGCVWVLDGLEPKIISTPAITALIQASGNVTTDVSSHDLRLAVAWCYQEDTHRFYCLQVPGCKWMLVYDLSTDRWHKRATWDSTAVDWTRGRPQCHMFFAGRHLVGDRLGGTIYEMSLDYFDEELAEV